MSYTKKQADAKLEAIEAYGNLARAIRKETFIKYNFTKLENAIGKMYFELHKDSENTYSEPIKNVGETKLTYLVQMLGQSIIFDLNNEQYWIKLLKKYYEI